MAIANAQGEPTFSLVQCENLRKRWCM
jgi:hypothetical protein